MRQHRHLGIYVLIARGEQLALIRKTRGPYRGLLDLPGGSSEFGETPIHTAIREVREETGLTITDLQLVNIWSHTGEYHDEQGPVHLHHLGVIYLAKSYTGQLTSQPDGQDAAGAAWYTNRESSLTPFASQAFRYLLSTPHGH